MPLVISDETLRSANLSEKDARVEIACLLFDAGKLDLWPAAQLAGLDRPHMEEELRRRGIPLYRPTIEEIRKEVEDLERLQESRVEIACRLFKKGELTLPMAGKFAGLSRTQMEEELQSRGIPAYPYTKEMIDEDLRTMARVKEDRRGAGRQ